MELRGCSSYLGEIKKKVCTHLQIYCRTIQEKFLSCLIFEQNLFRGDDKTFDQEIILTMLVPILLALSSTWLIKALSNLQITINTHSMQVLCLNKLRRVSHKNRLGNLFKLLSYANLPRVANTFFTEKRNGWQAFEIVELPCSPQMMHVVEAGSCAEKRDIASYYTLYIVNNRLSAVNK